MKVFEEIVTKLSALMYKVAGVAMVAMMLITTLDVLLRLAVTVYASTGWGFLKPLQPIAGTYELVCLIGAVSASFAMAHTSLKKGHVSVSILTQLFPKRLRAATKIATTSLGITLFGLIGWFSIVNGMKMQARGEVSMTLRLPFHPFVYGLSFGAFVVCLVLVTSLANTLRGGEDF